MYVYINQEKATTNRQRKRELLGGGRVGGGEGGRRGGRRKGERRRWKHSGNKRMSREDGEGGKTARALTWKNAQNFTKCSSILALSNGATA